MNLVSINPGMMIWTIEVWASGGAMPLVARRITVYVPVCVGVPVTRRVWSS